jgi:hypothetical protein
MAEPWIDAVVTIYGCGGFIHYHNGTDAISTGPTGSPILISRAPAHFGADKVTFSVSRNSNNATATNVGTDERLYLTQCLYGDGPKAELANALLQISPQLGLLPELVPNIVDYLADQATAEGNFEGVGFNYKPLSAQPGPPNWLSVFTIQAQEGHHDVNAVGIQSPFGRYWRSEHWNRVVSQAPHCFGDETWTLHSVNTERNERTAERTNRRRGGGRPSNARTRQGRRLESSF